MAPLIPVYTHQLQQISMSTDTDRQHQRNAEQLDTRGEEWPMGGCKNYLLLDSQILYFFDVFGVGDCEDEEFLYLPLIFSSSSFFDLCVCLMVINLSQVEDIYRLGIPYKTLMARSANNYNQSE